MRPPHMPAVTHAIHALPKILAARPHVVPVVPVTLALPATLVPPVTLVARPHVVPVVPAHVPLTSFALTWTAI